MRKLWRWLKSSEALRILFFFFKTTIINFGGGNALFPIIRRRVVEEEEWLSHKRFDRAFIVAHSIPGPTVVQVLSYVCVRRLGTFKGLLVCFFVFLPHALLTLGLLYLFNSLTNKRYIFVFSIAITPIVIANLILFIQKYIKISMTEIVWPFALFLILFATFYCLFVPIPYNLPVLPIFFVIFFTSIFEFVKRRKKRQKKQEDS